MESEVQYLQRHLNTLLENRNTLKKAWAGKTISRESYLARKKDVSEAIVERRAELREAKRKARG